MSKKVLLCFFAMFVLLGCKGNPVVGDWTATSPMGSTTLSFHADKTFDGKIGTTNFLHGSYEVDGKTIKMTATQMGGTTIPGAPDSGQNATLSDDGKSINMGGVNFVKQ